MNPLGLLTPLLLVALGCAAEPRTEVSMEPSSEAASVTPTADPAALVADPDTALFAGGCFWCMEPPFERLDGVLSVTSGFAGGPLPEPTYDEVSRGGTGHAEVVLIVYDPDRVTYEQLLDVFWRNVDPLSAAGQFCDRGDPYRSAIFALDAAQARLAEASFEAVQARFDEPVVTELNGAADFFPAEDYHQDFYKKNPERYYSYRAGCGRDARLEALWGDEAGHGASH